MSDRPTCSVPTSSVQTHPSRSNSCNPPPPLGSHRSRRTLSLPARDKPMIPPVISENPESGGDQNTEEILQPPIECYEIGTLIEPFGPTSCTGCKFLKFVIWTILLFWSTGWLSPVVGFLVSLLLYAWACLLSLLADKDLEIHWEFFSVSRDPWAFLIHAPVRRLKSFLKGSKAFNNSIFLETRIHFLHDTFWFDRYRQQMLW